MSVCEVSGAPDAGLGRRLGCREARAAVAKLKRFLASADLCRLLRKWLQQWGLPELLKCGGCWTSGGTGIGRDSGG